MSDQPTSVVAVLRMTPVAGVYSGGPDDTHRRLVTHLKQPGKGEWCETCNTFHGGDGTWDWYDPQTGELIRNTGDAEWHPPGYSTIKLYANDRDRLEQGKVYNVTVTTDGEDFVQPKVPEEAGTVANSNIGSTP